MHRPTSSPHELVDTTTAPSPAAASVPRPVSVSVVMPILNEERHLEEAVAAVLGQDYDGPLEVMLALGPSRDRTDEIAARLERADPRVRTVPNPTGPHPLRAERRDRRLRRRHHRARRRPRGAGPRTTSGPPWRAAGGDGRGQRRRPDGRRGHHGVRAGGRGGDDLAARGRRRPVPHRRRGRAGRHRLPRRVPPRVARPGWAATTTAFIRAQDWELNHRIRAAGGLVWFSPPLRVTLPARGATLRALARQYRDYGRWRRVVARQHRGTINAALPRAAGGARRRRRRVPVGGCFWRPAVAAARRLPRRDDRRRARPSRASAGPSASGCRRSCRPCTCRGAGASSPAPARSSPAARAARANRPVRRHRRRRPPGLA